MAMRRCVCVSLRVICVFFLVGAGETEEESEHLH